MSSNGEPKGSHNSNQDRSHEGDHATSAYEKALEGALREAEEQKQSRRQKAHEYFGKWENRVSLATLLFVAAYTTITLGIFIAGLCSLYLAQQAIIEGNRAWVSPWRMELAKPIAVGNPIETVLKYQNVGKSPATDLEVITKSSFTDPMPNGEGFDKMNILPNDSCDDPTITKLNSVVYMPAPGNDTYFTSQASRAPWLGSDEILSGKKIYYVLGCLRYKTLGNVGRSGFCFMLPAENARGGPHTEFTLCPRGNFAD